MRRTPSLGNELTAETGGEGEGEGEGGGSSSAQTEIEFVNSPPETDPPEESGRTGLKILTTGSYVSPAYVQGTKPEDAADVCWRCKGQSGWSKVSSTGEVGDTWWALFVDIDRSGETQDLTQDDREVTSGNAAGTGDVVEQKITWKVTKVAESRGAPVGDGCACGPLLWYTPHIRRHTDGDPVAAQRCTYHVNSPKGKGPPWRSDALLFWC